MRTVTPTSVAHGILALLLLCSYGITPFAASAQTVPNPDPDYVKITINSVTPSIAEIDSATTGPTYDGEQQGTDDTVTVSGTLRNTSSRPIGSLELRLQRGPEVTALGALRTSLSWGEGAFQDRGSFMPVAETLEPGDSSDFVISAPLDAARSQPGLGITDPGIYPLLVNVNGVPEGYGQARLHDARTLLAVRSRIPSPTPVPRDLTVIWPFATQPSRIAEVPGGENYQPTVHLTSTALIEELADGGRLSRALSAAERAVGDAQLSSSLCFAIDPDLLSTVADIARGAPVVLDPLDFDGLVGRNPLPSNEQMQERATQWRERLSALVQKRCVVPLPPAGVDLDALARLDRPRFTALALQRPALVIEQELSVAPLPGLVIPSTGVLGPNTATALGLSGTRALVAISSLRSDTGTVPKPGVLAVTQPAMSAIGIDDTISTALAATADSPENPSFSAMSNRYILRADSAIAHGQNAIAAIAAPVIADSASSSQRSAPEPEEKLPGAAPADTDDGSAPLSTPANLIVSPPPTWDLSTEQLTTFTNFLTSSLARGELLARPLAQLAVAPAVGYPGTLASDPTGSVDPGRITDDSVGLAANSANSIDVVRAIATDPMEDPKVGQSLDPFDGDVMRALSAFGRRSDGDGTADSVTGEFANERTQRRLSILSDRLTDTRNKVVLLPPGSVFTMASSNSPLLLVARNELPFAVSVDVIVDPPPEVHITPVGVLSVPALGSRTIQIPTETEQDSGRYEIGLLLRSPNGANLTEPTTITIKAGGFQIATAVFTAGAALVMFILLGRRLLRLRASRRHTDDKGQIA